MANTTKKYVSLNRLSTFLDNLKSVFATKTELEVVNTAISGKAPSSHTHAVSDVTNLQPILDERVNQNAFSYVKVGDTSIAADKATDTLTMVASTNVTITPDATNDKITISAKDTTYSAGAGISLNGTTFSNSGVRSVTTGSNNGTISVNTNGSSTNVAVKGLGSAAYTNSTAYDSAGTAKTKADEALASAKTYTDTKISNMVGSSSVSSQISSAINGLATETYVNNKVAGIVNSAPETLDTLNELATALGNDPNFATTVATQIGTKVDKVSGKGLSTNDYTTAEKKQVAANTTARHTHSNKAVLDKITSEKTAEWDSSIIVTFHGRWNDTDNSIVFSSTSTPYDDIQALLAAGKTPELSIQNDYGDWEAKFYLSRDGDGQYQFFSYERKMDGTPLLSSITVLDDNSAIWRGIDLDNKLDCSGGAMTGQLTLNSTLILSSATYGNTLPASGVAGQVFFVKV